MNGREGALLSAALDYVQLGWRVHPIRPRDKRPLLKGWPDAATTDEATIRKWWGDWPDANVGVVTGPSSGVVVIDVDGEAGEESLAQLQARYGRLPDTCEQITGRGRQLFFAVPATALIGNTTALGGSPGVDVRGSGGYVVVPPSVHPNGKTYTWEISSDPRDGVVIAKLPPAWVELLAVPASQRERDLPSQPSQKDGTILREGDRNDSLFRLACSLRTRGLLQKEIAAALFERNKSACQPPLDQKEVLGIAASAASYPPGSPKAENPTLSWEPPIPLGHFDLPSFSIEAIPNQLCAISAFCARVAESFQVPLDLPVLLVLAVLGAALAKRVIVWGGGDWREPLNLFIAVAMSSGERKSSVFREVTQPFTQFESEEAQRLGPEIAQNQTERLILFNRLKKATSKAAEAAKPEDREKWTMEAKQLTAELHQKKVMTAPRMVADDATPEALSRLMLENEGRIALLSPEGDTFDLMAGRYSANGTPNLGVYLKGHAGDDIRVDRVSKERPPEFVREPALTVGLAVQPEVLRGLVERPGFRGRGLLARFIYALPHSKVGFRALTPPAVPDDVRQAYARLIRTALAVTPAYDERGNECPHVLRLNAAAMTEFNRFRAEVEVALRESGSLAELRDWGSKLPGAVLRIAGSFHTLIQIQSGVPGAKEIDSETILCAIAIGEYALAHAKAAFFEMSVNPAVGLARKILIWLSEERHTSFTRREVFNRVRGAVQRVEELDEPLRLLGEHGYIRERETKRSGPGRKPSQAFDVNPLFLAQNTQNAHNSNVDPDSAYCAQSAQGG